MTILFIIAAFAVLTWLTWFALRGSLLAGCSLFVLVAACLGFEFLQFDVGPLPLTLDRLAFIVLVGTYLVQRFLGQTDPKPIDRGDLLIFAFVGLLVANTFTHDWRATSGAEVIPLWRLIAGYLVPFTVFWIAKQAPLSRSGVRGLHAVLAGFGLYLAITGILEITGQWSLVFPKHIADADLGLHFGRARGPMLQSATFGLCLTIGMLALLVSLPRLTPRGRLLLFGTLPLFFASIYFSYTRTVWLGAVASLAVLLWTVLSGPRRIVTFAAIGTIVLAVGITRWDQIVALKRDSSAADTRSSTTMRASFAYVSWQMFLDRPIWGCGFGHFPIAKRDYLADRAIDLPLTEIWHEAHHNVLLSLLTETGLLGMLLFAAILGLWGLSSWQLWSDGMLPDWMRWHGLLMMTTLAAYFFALLFFELSYSPIDNSLVFYLAGVTAGLRSMAGHAAPAALPGLLGHWQRGAGHATPIHS